jgi:hypothetical protein
MAQFLKQNSAQLNTDWRVCNPQPRTPMDRDYHRQKALKYNFTVIIIITFSPHPHLHLIVSLKYNVFYRRTVFHVCKNLCTFIRFVMFQDSETKFDLMLNSSNEKFCTCVSYSIRFPWGITFWSIYPFSSIIPVLLQNSRIL